ncbi:tail fiber/spike domain-containing protein, partial [Enterobacter asburiae]|uniref:tail fiber/spike domain-containing protein n=1 Tax=Enterobacter asburiae TaxID=61645 RepID=UPI0035C556C3
MATQPTNLPVPSESPRDLKFNAGKIDEFVTSLQHEYEDRCGKKHYTIEGLRWVAQQAISAFGYITLDSFEDGNNLTLPNQVLRLKATGEYYRWDGAFPKNVPASSTPDSTGGIGVGKWLSVGDATLRSDLRKNTGATIIGTDTGDTVQKRIDDIITFQTSVDSEAYSRKNINYLANADFLIRTKSPIKILFQGDSMTAGLDQKSTDSVPPENGDWARHASITYHERVVSF